jgi:hypothetical protein
MQMTRETIHFSVVVIHSRYDRLGVVSRQIPQLIEPLNLICRLADRAYATTVKKKLFLRHWPSLVLERYDSHNGERPPSIQKIAD